MSNFNKVKKYICVCYHVFIGVTRSKCYHGIFKVSDIYVYSEKTVKVQLSFQAGVGARLRFQGSISLRLRTRMVVVVTIISWPYHGQSIICRKGGF